MPQLEDPFFNVFNLYQNYYGGFTFFWALNKNIRMATPITYEVQFSTTGLGDWVSKSDILTTTTWREDCSNIRNKNNNRFYRVKGIEANGKEHFSSEVTALNPQDFRSFVYAKEIMRKEVLQMRNLSGVEVHVYRKMHEGTNCTVCRDSITKQILDPTCVLCGGTGFTIGWYGPFPAYATFSPRVTDKKFAEGGSFVEDDRANQVRVVGSPSLVREDMIVDTKSNLRYVVGKVDSEIELRRVAVVQLIVATEIETHDVRYAV